MPKLVDVKALRAEAKDKRNQIAEIRKSRVAANADLRAAQKVVADIDKTLNKAVADLAKIKAKIDKATG